MRRSTRLAVCLCGIFCLFQATLLAATFNVTTYIDISDSTPDGSCDSCSLREAIQEANFLAGPDVINVPPGTYSMDIAGADEDLGQTGDLDVTDDVTIIGIGTTRIESHVGRILHVHSGNVSITGLTLQQGDANNDQSSGSAGGAVHNAAGSTLTLNLFTMTINQAQGGGGGIFNGGTLSINGSTLTANSAVGSSRGGAVYNNGTMTVTNCTIHGNSSTDGGGGVYNAPGAVLSINNTTITDNASTGGVGGGGIHAAATSTVNISNTVIANNTASGANDDCEGLLTSLGSNLVEDPDGCGGLGAGDISLVDPLLGPLQNNGGRTFTREPQAGSQVLESGGTMAACELVDQRGLARPQGAACDIGAYEEFPACPSITLAPATLLDGQAGVWYTETIAPQGGIPPSQFAVLAGSLPDGLALGTNSGVLSGVPTKSGGNDFTIAAFDANLCPGSLDYSLNLVSGPSCSPTSITLSPTNLPVATPREGYSQFLVASGGVSPHLYTVTDGALPPGLTLDVNTGEVGGAPAASGTFLFVATATDANTCTGDQGYALQVECFYTFSPSSLVAVRAGVPYTQTLKIASGGTEPFAFAVVSGSLPPGLSLTGPGILSGTPTVPGTYTFMVEATDAYFCQGSIGYILVIDPCIEISPGTLPNGVVGSAYTTSLTATGGSAPISFSVTQGTLPPGLTLDAAGSVTGSPSAEGSYLFTVTATDGSCFVDQDYFLLVSPAGCPAITITPATLPNDTVGNNYSQNLSGNGGQSPYSFQLVSGLLPPGIGLSSNGSLSGTSLDSGSFTFTIAATDSDGCAGSQSYTVIIIPTTCPEISLFPPILPDGSRGVPYDQTVLATGGIPPYGYALASGTLPPGLVFDGVTGVLSGMPTTLGDFDFAITATDAAGCAGSLGYTLRIIPSFGGGDCSVYADWFEDDVLATDWSYLKPAWSETAGNLVGTPGGKKAIAVATPAFPGCLNCAIETTIQTGSGDGKVVLLAWYVDKSNTIEVTASQETNKWTLSQRAGGDVVAKAKAPKPIDANVPYTVRVVFDGVKFDLFVDNMVTPLTSLTPKKAVQAGTVGFQAKGTKGTFGYLCVD